MIYVVIVVFLVCFVLGLCTVFLAGVHQPIQLKGRVADFSQARAALAVATLLHWTALFSVAFNFTWMQASPLRSQLIILSIYLLAQVLLWVSFKQTRLEAEVYLRPRIQAGRFAIVTVLCGILMIVPGVIYVLGILGVDTHLHL